MSTQFRHVCDQMPFEAFLDNFDELAMSHLQPDSLTSEIADDKGKQSWQVVVYHDAWIKGVTAGGRWNPLFKDLYWKNPQFFVTLKDVDITDNRNVCTLIVSLIEKEKDNRSKIAMAYALYRLKNPQLRPLDGESVSRNALVLEKRTGVYEYNREKTKRFELSPGSYVVIPSTFEPNEEAEFMLRIITEKPCVSGVLDEDSDPTEFFACKDVSPAIEEPVRSTFKQCAGEYGKLYARELKNFLVTISSIELEEQLKFSTESCRSLITMLDMVFKQFDKDRSGYVDTYELKDMFVKLGFPISRKVTTSIVRRYGGKDSEISLADFITMVCKLTLMFAVFKDQQIESGGGETANFRINEFLSYVMYC